MLSRIVLFVFLFSFTTTMAQEAPKLNLGEPLPANIFVELAKAINPAVVNVGVSFRAQSGPGGRDPLLDLLEQFMGPQGRGGGGGRGPETDQPQGIGTGFIIESDGLIITNNHVIDGAQTVKVQLINDPGKFLDAEVVGSDPRTDIALIRIKSSRKNFPTVKLGSSKSVQVGEWVAAFGNPYGHTFSMSKGIVSAIGRQIREINAVPFIQTDASINPGNSGGPLVNMKGEVIAVNAAIDARAQGIGFAIPIDSIKELIPQLKEKGRVIRGYLGIGIDELSPRAKQALDVPVNKGALIMNVEEGSPADKSGIEPYDVFTKFNGKAIEGPQDLMDAVADSQIGSTVQAEIYRGGKKITKSVKVGEPPQARSPLRRGRPMDEPPSSGATTDDIGFTLADYSSKLAKDFGLPANAPKQPIVTRVIKGSPAALAGLRTGDLILEVNKSKVTKATEVSQKLQPGNNMLRVQNGTQVSIIFLTL